MSKAHYMAKELEKIGFKPEYKTEFFHEFVTVSDVSSEKAVNGKCCIDKAVSILKEVK